MNDSVEVEPDPVEVVLKMGLALSLVVSLVFFGLRVERQAAFKNAAIRQCEKALVEHQNLELEMRGETLITLFESHTEGNIAVTCTPYGSVDRRQLNYSRMAGNWAGKTTKRATKGFFKGLFSKDEDFSGTKED